MQANRTRSRSLLSPFLHPGEGGERTEGQARPASDQRHGGERSRDFGSRGPRSPLFYASAMGASDLDPSDSLSLGLGFLA